LTTTGTATGIPVCWDAIVVDPAEEARAFSSSALLLLVMLVGAASAGFVVAVGADISDVGDAAVVVDGGMAAEGLDEALSVIFFTDL